MQKLLREYLDELNRKQKRRRKTVIAVVLAAIMLVSGVIWNLTQYGIAMTDEPKCGMEEHTHSDSCYADVLTCGREESAGHTHTDACYQTVSELICGQEESEEHTHSEACYQTVSELICGQEESEGHTHTDACYEKQLSCGKEEHTHSEACYIDTTADVEDASIWNAQYADTKWKDAWGEDLVIAAKKQIGYKESTDNYTVATDGSHKGYTRYGQFAGDVYAGWDAVFVNFCMHYAGLEKTGLFPKETETAKWHEKFAKGNAGQNAAYLTDAKDYEPQIGDILFFQKEKEETDDQMGIISSYDKEKNEIKVIEGNSDNAVKENKYAADDKHITAYLKISELETAYKSGEIKTGQEETGEQPEGETEEADSGKRVMTAEGADYTVTVSFTEEAGIPEEAVLDVKELEKDSEEYLAHYYQTMEILSVNELQSARFFDITFLVNGEEIEPTAPVEVSIKCEDVKDADVVHFAKEGTEVLDAVNSGTDHSISFTQNSFSVTALAERATGEGTYYEKTSISNVDELNGKSFLIVRQSDNSNQACCFGDSASSDRLNGIAVAIQEEDIINLTNAALWTFEKVDGSNNQYYLKNENGKYLRIDEEEIKVGDQNNKAKLTIEVDSNGGIRINRNSYYIQRNGNNNNFDATNKSNGDLLTLYLPKAASELGDQFHPVPTVTSDAFQIKMVDYSGTEGYIPFSGAGWSDNNNVNSGRNIKQGILSKQLAANGYPTFMGTYSTPASGTDFGNIFNSGTSTDVKQSLFQLDEQGYYYYDSMENSARLVGNDFIVYEELTSPKNVEQGTQDSIYGVGNFLPYDNFYQMKRSGSGNQHTNNNEQYKDQLYLPDGSAHYYFGMELTTNFYQMRNGYNNENPMIYEFSGDDDMWVYIDGVLVLDLGGCHDRRGGSINFATGEVRTETTAGNYTITYLDRIFENAGFDTTGWKTVEGSKHKIFPDYSKHSFKMWYLERGAGASNLKVKFNLPVVAPGEVQVEKKLSNTDKEKYANVEFGFQVFLQPWQGTDTDGNDIFDDDAKVEDYRPLCKELQELGKTNAKVYKIKTDGTQEEISLPTLITQKLDKDGNGFSNSCTTEAVFYLKPGEKLKIEGLKQNRKYYVREVGTVSDEYDKVIVNNTEVDVEGNGKDGVTVGSGSDGEKYIQSAEDRVTDRPYISYTNNCSEFNKKELQITKKLAEGQTLVNVNDTFTFMVWLEGQDGVLIPYSGNYYITHSGESTSAELNTTNGKIPNIMVGDTVAICQILSGTDFLVEEIFDGDQANAYSIPEITLKEGTYDTPTSPAETDDGKVAIGSIKLRQDAKVTVTNSRNMERIWQIVKRSTSVGSDGQYPTLEGAKFGLYEETDIELNLKLPKYYGKSDVDGIVKWYSDEACTELFQDNIPAGTYTFKELIAPTGYTKSDEIWTIEIREDNKITVTSNKPEDFGDNIKTVVTDDSSKIVETTTVYFENTALYSLPSAGGPGIYWYIFSGILLMAGAMLIIYKNKRKEVLKS